MNFNPELLLGHRLPSDIDSSDIGGRNLRSPNAEMHGIIPCNSWYYTMKQFMVLYLDYCKV